MNNKLNVSSKISLNKNGYFGLRVGFNLVGVRRRSRVTKSRYLCSVVLTSQNSESHLLHPSYHEFPS